jgi:Kef-type K+ transport system membrane component KefB
MPISFQTRRVTPAILSFAMIVSAPLWFVAAHVFYVANRDSKDGISNAPLWTYLFLILIPTSTFLLLPMLLKERQNEGRRLQVVDYCGVMAGIAPFAFLAIVFLSSLVGSLTGAD